MKDYRTSWKKGDKKGTYRTKALTPMHKCIHDDPKVEYASTIETDSTVDWPFGLYSEVIATTDRNNPKRNKPIHDLYFTDESGERYSATYRKEEKRLVGFDVYKNFNFLHFVSIHPFTLNGETIIANTLDKAIAAAIKIEEEVEKAEKAFNKNHPELNP